MSLALAASAAFAQYDIKVQAPNLVAVGEAFNVVFVLDGERNVSSFNWAPGDDFQLVWGPQKGSSTSINMVNGKTTRSSQVTYSYVLMPNRAGTFQLPAAEATVKGETLRSKAVSIQVVSDGSQSSSSSQPQGGQQSSGNSDASTGTVSGEDLFLRLSLSRTRVVVGESIVATLKLYQRANITGFEDARFPTFDGFWSQELQAPQNIEFQREALGDRIYNSAVLRSWTLIPQRAGDIRIDPAEIVCKVAVRAPSSTTGSIFDSFFQDDYRTIRKRVSSDAYTVHVSSLPSGAPASFGGGVGTFSMSASLTRDSLRAHDAASLNVTVTGKGNISLLEAPKINFPPDFEVYDVKVNETAGGKTFEYPFIPRSHGDFVLGPVEYSYYDVTQGRYVTLRSQEMGIRVSRGNEEASYSGQTVAAPASKKDVRNLGSDIRFIRTGVPSLKQKGDIFIGSGLYWLIALLLALSAAAMYFALRGLAARRADIVGTKSRAATKMARKRLSSAGEYLSKDLYSAFYEELHKALLGFVSDKLNMDIADMSKDNIASRLAGAGTPEPLCEEFVALIDACEFARYSPSSGHDAMSAHYEKAVSVISMIDEKMKRNPSKSGAAAAVLVLLALLPARTYAGNDAYCDSLWNAGVSAYNEGMWQDACTDWSSILENGVESPELFYNIGNAYFKQQEYALAILNYERALKLDPSDPDARYNLEYLNTLIQDRVEEVPEFFVKTWLRKLSYLMPSGAWAAVSLISFAAALAMLMMFLLSSSGIRRKVGFFASLAFVAVALLALSSGLRQRSERMDSDEAVIMVPVSSVKSSPGNTSTDLFVLHEGTRVHLLDTVGDWTNIQLLDGRQGWIPVSDMENI